jgi:hypothetical protein
MSDTESFESVMDTLLDGFVHNVLTNQLRGPYDMIAANIERLRRAHDREIRDVSQQQYHRGFNDGTHSMDAEHRAVAMRLRALPLDGGSHENLSQIARAVYHADWGWTKGACMSLRDKLIDLMGGVSDGTAEPMTTDELIEYINEDTRRLKGDGAMEVSDDTCDSQCRGACVDCDDGDSREQVEVSVGGCEWLRDGTVSDSLIPVWPRDEKKTEVTDERFADDSADDSRGGDGGGDLHMAGVSITDELRECVYTATKTYDDTPWHEMDGDSNADHTICYVTEGELMRIADRIDEQFDRICQQQEDVLQETIDEVVDERDELMKQRAEMTAELARRLEQRDAARARTDELSDELLRTRRERDEMRAKLAIIREAIDG